METTSDLSAKLYDPLLRGALKPLRRAIMHALPENKNIKILDLCCGTGDQLHTLDDMGYTDLHGVDLSSKMLAVAKKKSPRLTLHEEDASATSLINASFDAILISLALHEKDQLLQHAILKEIARLLTPDGIAIVADFCFDDRTHAWGRFMISAIEAFAGGEHYRNFKDYTRQGGMENILSDGLFEFHEVDRVLRNGIGVWKLSAGH
ncbi:MAG: methyltransferase domain-containing protein [Candidatus Marinimicrobia bacterium]|nr:methyltransferase domain-containing protein [Candidatus Neomarinimicrobiota bacterium]